MEIFDDSDKVVADVVLLHGCPKGCMPHTEQTRKRWEKTQKDRKREGGGDRQMRETRKDRDGKTDERDKKRHRETGKQTRGT